MPDGSSLPSDANISYVLSANPFSSKISIENDGSDDYLVLANNINVGIYSNILLISSARADDTNKTLLGTCQIRFTIEIIKKQITILPSQIKIGSTAGANDSANAADTQSFAYNPTTTTTTTSLEITVDFTSIDVLHSDISKFTNTFQQTSTEPFPTGVSIDSNSNDKLLIASNANVTSATGFLFSLKATIIENSTSNYVFSSNSAWFNLKISKNKIPTTGVNITLSNDINNGGYAYITGYNTAPEINIEYNSGFLSSSSGA
ncbi:hypothetical protein FACS189459_3310 [Bacilli bacterium]|nr:hypothetical protein FACS189459_3310 [Bacilli bacterium]